MTLVNRIFLRGILCMLACLFVFTIAGQEPEDSIRIHTLREVHVKGVSNRSSTRSPSPLQLLDREKLEKLNSLQVSDATKFFSGVQVKDYGGLGGLKTVSIRSLGANYTGVYYDGAAISNYQSGQIDIGRFSLVDVDRLELQTGESDNIFLPARMQAYAGSLHIVSKKPLQNSSRLRQVTAAVNGGSWAFFNPYLSYEQCLSKTISTRISGEWVQSDGNYPYTSGSGERKTREHSDVENLKIEANLYGNFRNGGELSVKAYGYSSDRSLPGADYFYTTTPGENAREQNLFVQAQYTQNLSEKDKMLTVAKFDYNHADYNSYLHGDKNYLYYQREYYVGTSFIHYFLPVLSASFSNDGSYAGFYNRSMGVNPYRASWQGALSIQFKRPRFTATMSLQSLYSHDTGSVNAEGNDLFRLSPAADFSFRLFTDIPLHFRGFYKQTCRQPTFGDLYLSQVPPTGLKPETANQYNLGFTWSHATGSWLPFIGISADGYWNSVKNKIISYPKMGMFIWSVENLEKVDIKGIDAKVNFHLQTGSYFLWQCGLSYTYQKVLNKTSPGSKTYNQQIIYTPNHSGSGYLALVLPWIEVGYTALYCGERYYGTHSDFQMNAYTDQSISLSKIFSYKQSEIKLSAECLNLADEQYEVVRSYPMPGRSFRIGVKFTY